MEYSDEETDSLKVEDFTKHFVGSIGGHDAMIDVLTFVHHSISFDKAEKNKIEFEIQPGTLLNIVPYDVLKEMKLLTHREKDLFDIARLEEIKNSLNPEK